MKKLKDIRIRSKIIALLLFPFMGFIYFSANVIVEKKQSYNEMVSLQELSQLAVKISSMVHETQKERGRTAGFLGSGGEKFTRELPEQRQLTDQKTEELETFLNDFDAAKFGKDFRDELNSALVELKKIENIRSDVTVLRIKTADAIGYYTGLNAQFLNSIGQMTIISTKAEITTVISAYVNFLQSKERAGIERAVLSNTFAVNVFGDGVYEKFLTLVAEQNTFANVFLSFASNEQESFYTLKLSDNSVSEVERMRTAAKDNAISGNFGIDADDWFTTITKKINILKEIEDKLSDDLYIITSELKSSSMEALSFYSIVTLIAILISVFLSVLIIKRITAPLNDMKSLASKIANGDINQSIEFASKDEIGALADSFRSLIEAQKEKARVAEQIAEGNLNVNINVLSEKDVLGNSMVSMRDILLKMQKEIESLIAAVQEGRLKVRGKADEFVGGWQGLIAGVNNLVEAFVGPINVTSDYIEKIAGGNIPEKITDTYQGDFNDIKVNLNSCIEAVGALVEDTNNLVASAMEGKLDARVHTDDVNQNGVKDQIPALYNKYYEPDNGSGNGNRSLIPDEIRLQDDEFGNF